MEILSRLLSIRKISATVDRERELRAEYHTKVKPAGWKTTDPINHDPRNFRYIVHMTSGARLNNGAWMSYARGIGPKRELSGNSWEVLLADFLSHNSISCSLVDEVHRGTYMYDEHPGGFILDVPEENIIAIDPTDLGTPNHVQDKQAREDWGQIKRGRELKSKTASAQDFLNDCSISRNNEVVIDGIGPEGRQIRISGMFLVTEPILGIPLYELHTRLTWSPREILARLTSPGYWEDERFGIDLKKKQYREIKELAKLLSVPIIRIPAPLLI